MLSPRELFACAAIPHSGQIIVAGGGLRHSVEGSGMSSVERYDVGRDEWVTMEGLSLIRANCKGFLVRNGEESEFWVVGGYRESEDEFDGEFCTDALVLDVKRNEVGKWRKIGDMVQEGSDIFRYNMASNFWEKESTVPETTVPGLAPSNSSCVFVELDGELHVVTYLIGVDLPEKQKLEQQNNDGTLLIRSYHLWKKTWRSITTKPPFNRPLDFNRAVMCTVRL